MHETVKKFQTIDEKPKKNINVAFRVDLARRKELKQIALERDTSIQQMLEEGLDLLLKRPMATMKPTRFESEWHIMLTDILKSGDHQAISSLKQHVTYLHRTIKGRR